MTRQVHCQQLENEMTKFLKITRCRMHKSARHCLYLPYSISKLAALSGSPTSFKHILEEFIRDGRATITTAIGVLNMRKEKIIGKQNKTCFDRFISVLTEFYTKVKALQNKCESFYPLALYYLLANENPT